MHLAGALWSHHLPCNIAQARGHVVRQVEFSRPHWPFRGPELTEGSVFPSAFAFQKGRVRVCVHRTHLLMCLVLWKAILLVQENDKQAAHCQAVWI